MLWAVAVGGNGGTNVRSTRDAGRVQLFYSLGDFVSNRSFYDGLRPVARIQFFPGRCLVSTSVKPAWILRSRTIEGAWARFSRSNEKASGPVCPLAFSSHRSFGFAVAHCASAGQAGERWAVEICSCEKSRLQSTTATTRAPTRTKCRR